MAAKCIPLRNPAAPSLICKGNARQAEPSLTGTDKQGRVVHYLVNPHYSPVISFLLPACSIPVAERSHFITTEFYSSGATLAAQAEVWRWVSNEPEAPLRNELECKHCSEIFLSKSKPLRALQHLKRCPQAKAFFQRYADQNLFIQAVILLFSWLQPPRKRPDGFYARAFSRTAGERETEENVKKGTGTCTGGRADTFFRTHGPVFLLFGDSSPVL